MSCGVPYSTIAEHGVEDRQARAHAGGDGYLGKLAGGIQALMEQLDPRVVPDGRLRGHIGHRPHFAAPAPDAPLAFVAARVARQGRYSHQLGDLAPLQAPQLGQRRGERESAHRPHALEAVQQRALLLEVALQRVVGLAVDGGDLRSERLEDDLDALGGTRTRQREPVAFRHAHFDELPAARHQHRQVAALFIDPGSDVLGALGMPRQHVGKVAQKARIDFVGLGQNAHRFGEIARLAGIDARDRKARALQLAHHGALVAARGFEYDQIDFGRRQQRDQLVPPRRVVGQAPFVRRTADIEMLLGNVDSGVPTWIALRYPTLRMHVHDWQLFGLHGWRETGQCVDHKLTRELKAHRRIRFGAPTATVVRPRRLWTSGQFELRSKRLSCLGQRCALPTAPASDHLPTAFDDDVHKRYLEYTRRSRNPTPLPYAKPFPWEK